MLIDLARNDLGRIAKTGSVKVTEAFIVERYSHVMHLVSNVEGLLKEWHEQSGRLAGYLSCRYAHGGTKNPGNAGHR